MAEIEKLMGVSASDIEKVKSSNMKNSKKVEDNLVDIIAKIGEKITIGRSKTILIERIDLHNQKINFIYETDLFVSYVLKNKNDSTKDKIASLLTLKEDLEGFIISRKQKMIKKNKSKRAISNVLQLKSPSGLDIQIRKNHRQNRNSIDYQ